MARHVCFVLPSTGHIIGNVNDYLSDKLPFAGFRLYDGDMKSFSSNTAGFVERRDPCSPIILLGNAMSRAHRQRADGVINVEEGEHRQQVVVHRGVICEVRGAGKGDPLEQGVKLFEMNRPRVTWATNQSAYNSAHYRRGISPDAAVIRGVLSQQQRFDPVQLAERIPVEHLEIHPSVRSYLNELPFTSEEWKFLRQLQRPTPISMILWKRGLAPSHAASMLVALNLLGAWMDRWRPGDLPRLSMGMRLLKKGQRQVSDWGLLGISFDATVAEQDRAYRQLALQFHPDRTAGISTEEQDICRQAFTLITDAYERLKRHRHTRRQPRVMNRGTGCLWQNALADAEVAHAQGNRFIAQKQALLALSLDPPPFVRSRLRDLLRRAA